MARVGFRMQLKPGNEEEYRRRHDEVWPELARLLRDTGIRNYSIYRDGTTLFAYLEIDDPAALERTGRGRAHEEVVALHGAAHGLQSGQLARRDPLEEAFHMD